MAYFGSTASNAAIFDIFYTLLINVFYENTNGIQTLSLLNQNVNASALSTISGLFNLKSKYCNSKTTSRNSTTFRSGMITSI